MHLTPDAAMVQGDKKRLIQVLANMLNNAAKYTPEGGHIQMRTAVRNAHVLIEVSDNGIGMAPDLVSRAFDLFAQAERTSDRSQGGLGSGLALVRAWSSSGAGGRRCRRPAACGSGGRVAQRAVEVDHAVELVAGTDPVVDRLAHHSFSGE
jgi:K+-sensing histidine kinase KdpD